MADHNLHAGAGGFLAGSLPSPSPSASSTPSTSGLPHPRNHALRPGSNKEDMVRRYVEAKMMHVRRRYVKKFGLAEPGDEIVGYKSMAELCRDVEAIVDTLWLSGTPSLQIPYLLNIAHEFNTWVTSFTPAPVATFSLLSKLDHCFASLLSGRDIETKEPLPGFENGLRGVLSKTDMVRCKSIVYQTRLLVVEALSRPPDAEDDDDEDDGIVTATDDTAAESDAPSSALGGGRPWSEDDERMHMDSARVYEHTILLLGDNLGDMVDRTALVEVEPDGTVSLESG